MFDVFKQDLLNKKKENLYRDIEITQGIDFTSNDYLNLSSHPQIRQSLIKALENNIDLSSKSSRLLAGTTKWHQEAEQELKKFTGRPATLSFSSGYLANIGLIPALSKNRVIFSDEQNHASLIDGIRLSKSPCHVFPHNDLNALEEKLKKEKKEKLIITESLFSMEGDFAPLKDLIDLSIKYQALLFVDEAHSTGLFGENLSGLTYPFKEYENLISVHTCGKALGSSGAFVACSSLIKNYLINNCRSFIYTTAPPPLLMVQWLSTLKVLEKEKERALDLRKKSLLFRQSLSLQETESPIISFAMKDTQDALQKSKLLKDKGFFIRAIRYPTVPKNKERLRIILQYKHHQKELHQLKKYLFTNAIN